MPRFTAAPMEQEKRQRLMKYGFSEKVAKQVLNGVWELRDVTYVVFVKPPNKEWVVDTNVSAQEADGFYEWLKPVFSGKED